MRHADFVSIREREKKINFGIFFVNGIDLGANVTAGFVGGKQQPVKIKLDHVSSSNLH